MAWRAAKMRTLTDRRKPAGLNPSPLLDKITMTRTFY